MVGQKGIGIIIGIIGLVLFILTQVGISQIDSSKIIANTLGILGMVLIIVGVGVFFKKEVSTEEHRRMGISPKGFLLVCVVMAVLILIAWGIGKSPKYVYNFAIGALLLWFGFFLIKVVYSAFKTGKIATRGVSYVYGPHPLYERKKNSIQFYLAIIISIIVLIIAIVYGISKILTGINLLFP